jgi:hypothetical protein
VAKSVGAQSRDRLAKLDGAPTAAGREAQKQPHRGLHAATAPGAVVTAVADEKILDTTRLELPERRSDRGLAIDYDSDEAPGRCYANGN